MHEIKNLLDQLKSEMVKMTKARVKNLKVEQ